MFTFEAIALVLPLENRMRDRQRFHGWNGLLSSSMLVVVILYATFGFFGYLAFGQDAQMVLSNLPRGSPAFGLVRIIYGASIFISYNLQLYVPVQILKPSLPSWLDEFGLRVFLIMVSCKLRIIISKNRV